MGTGGLSSARLGRMHDVMAGHVDGGGVPGLVTLVARHGEVHVDAIGTMAQGGSAPIGRDTIFRISSMTKPITAAATMILVEECTLRLDEPVDRWLPELANRQVLKRLNGTLDDTEPAKRAITVRDLLTFRMGFGQMMAPPDAYPILKAANEQQIGIGPPTPSSMPAPDEWMRRLGAYRSCINRGAVDVQHGVRRARRTDRARLRTGVGDVLARTPLRAARYEGHRLQRAGNLARPTGNQLLDRSRKRKAHRL